MNRHVDVLIIGAGISGIGIACHLTREKTGRSYLILERRQNVGGTWDLFRYPGIRSDSDMYSFGYHFRPWRGTRILAQGAKIRKYVEETAAENGVLDNINFGRTALSAKWSTDEGLWTVEATNQQTGETEIYTSQFLVGCTGYYNYDSPYQPEFPGAEDFKGQIIHPQFWPEDLDYTGKKVVVIGSGATAITLVPAMARQAGHVTMLQRSPTYVVALPSIDPVAVSLTKAHTPANTIYRLGRSRNIAIQRGFYELATRRPEAARAMVLGWVRAQVGNKIDMKHFTPSYMPWDQRICVVPNGDLFRTLKTGKADIVTDHIEKFDETGILLKSGQHIDADIIVTATGLTLQMLGGMHVEVDGKPVLPQDHVFYKAVAIDGVPNAIVIIGYTNISWTLKVDLAGEYFARLLKHMDAKGYTQFVANARPEDRSDTSVMGSSLSSGYIQRGNATMPRQGARKPWKVMNDYVRDLQMLKHGPIEDGVIQFRRAGSKSLLTSTKSAPRSALAGLSGGLSAGLSGGLGRLRSKV